MRHETQYIKITMNAGFNRLMTQYGKVSLDKQLVLKNGNGYVHLGTYKEAMDRAEGEDSVIGKGGHIYGHFGTPEIDDNLFVAVPIAETHPDNHDLQTLRPPTPTPNWLKY